MLHAGHFVMRHTTSFILSFLALTASILFFDINAFVTLFSMVVVYIGSASLMKTIQKRKQLQLFGLTKAEYHHIEEQLQLAQQRLAALQKQYLRVRSVTSFKKILEIGRIGKRIIATVKKDPRRFYAAEQFFYAHLESAVTLTEKYTLLTSQPLKDAEVKMALQQTQQTIELMHETIEGDLKGVLANDIEHLKIEIDFATSMADQKKKTIDIE